MKHALITAGRFPVALELARQLGCLGIKVTIADTLTRPIASWSCYVSGRVDLPPPAQDPAAYRQQLLDLLRHEPVDYLFPVFEEAMYLGPVRAELAAHCLPFFSDATLLAQLHHKHGVYALLNRHDLLGATSVQAPTSWMLDGRLTIAQLDPAMPCVAKRVYGRSGQLNRSGKAAQLLRDCPHDGSWMLQEQIDGEELCGFAMARDGRVGGVMVYSPKLRIGSIASAFEAQSHPLLEMWISRLLQAINYTGFIGFDFIKRDAQYFLIDCNPRPTSGLHFMPAEALGALLDSPVGTATNVPVSVSRPGQRLMVGFAVLQGMLQPDQFLAAWRTLFSARDCIYNNEDRGPALYALRSYLELRSLARRLHLPIQHAISHGYECNGPESMITSAIKLYSAAEIAQIPWEKSRSMTRQFFLPLMRRTPQAYAANLQAQIVLLETDKRLIPLVVPERGQNQSWVLSLRTYLSGSIQKSIDAGQLSVTQRLSMQAIMKLIAGFFALSDIDHAVFPHHWLITTNPLVESDFDDINALLDCLIHRYPDRYIICKSLNAHWHSSLIERMRQRGFVAIPFRPIYLYQPGTRLRRDLRNDFKLLERTEYRVVSNSGPYDYHRVAQLYGYLYLDKYDETGHPRFNHEFFRDLHQSGALTFCGLEDKSGQLDGFIAYLDDNETPYQVPFLGYDPERQAQGKQLYRQLTALMMKKAIKTQRFYNLSSGVGQFKLSRGGLRSMEYILVYARHLPARRSLPTTLLGRLVDTLVQRKIIDVAGLEGISYE